MPLSKLQFKPGINRENTNYAGEGGWFDCDKVRFRSGYPEKIGGWQNNAQGYTFKSICRNLWNWVTLNSSNLLALGTEQKLYVQNGTGSLYQDITPTTKGISGFESLLILDVNPFATVNGSKVVVVTDTGHGAITGMFVTFSGAQATSGSVINGIPLAEINTEHEIIEIINANSYRIRVSTTAATSTGSGGGNPSTVYATYQISPGNSLSAPGTGWGTGPWSREGWGSEFSGTAAVQETNQIRLWYMDNYGQDLAASVRYGSVYYMPVSVTAVFTASISLQVMTITTMTSGAVYAGMYISGTGVTANTRIVGQISGTIGGAGDYVVSVSQTVSPAVTVTATSSTAGFCRAIQLSRLADENGYDGDFIPHTVYEVHTSGVQRFSIAVGANPYDPTDPDTAFDPMLVRWSDQENIYQWVPAATNQAGELRLSHGSSLITGRHGRQEFVVWSDSAIYSMQYLGPPYIWGVNLLMDGISIASPNAVTGAANIMMWMGKDKFYIYDGIVKPLPCTVRQFIFDDFNYDQIDQVTAGGNEQYSEVWWFYPTADSTVNNRYVIYNYLEGTWYIGALNRTAWLDSSVRENPMGVFSIKESFLDGSVNSSTTTINLLDASSYPSSGTVQIDSEKITYASKNGNSLNNCTRGAESTTAASHNAYTPATFTVPNQVMFHEVGNDDNSTPTLTPIEAYISSSDFDIGDGHNFGFVWRIIPDLTFDGSNTSAPNKPAVTMVCKPRQFSGSAYGTPTAKTVNSLNDYSDPLNRTYNIQEYTGQVYTRVRGRQMAFEIRSSGQGVAWQLGVPRIDIRPDGKR